jgi:hypothetical protein
MSTQETAPGSPRPQPHPHRWRLLGRSVRFTALGLVVWASIAYLLLPLVWRHFDKRHPALENAPRITHTGDGIPGDPLNISLVGTERDLDAAMLAAKWYPADPITLKSSLRIAIGSAFHRPYDTAPVSNLYSFGRKQDLAFEQPIGSDPRRRHHVRFWQCEQLDEDGRPLWIGAATLDTHVGLSHTEGQITHHISSNVDAERDKIIADLTAADFLVRIYWVDDFQQPPEGRNGGGDPWRTDGRMAVGVIGLGKPAPVFTEPPP